jgi:hypothetical protein
MLVFKKGTKFYVSIDGGYLLPSVPDEWLPPHPCTEVRNRSIIGMPDDGQVQKLRYPKNVRPCIEMPLW